MAFKTTFLAALALASCAAAVPLAVDKRAAVTNTVTVTEWTTVDVTSTVWVDEKPSATAQVPSSAVAAAALTTTSAPVASTTPPAQPEAPVQPNQAQPQPQPEQPAPANAAADFAEQPQPQAASTTVAAAPAAATTSSAPSVEAKTAGASSGSGPCEGSGNACTGDVTYYEGGLGACGWTVDTASDMSIALPHGLMGTQSNGNPYCGRSVSIKASDGSTVTAKVGDKCMGCDGMSIDLTDALFKKVVPNGDGRVSGVQWWFD